MLAKGTRITIHSNGTTIPVQDLRPGDDVYSPLTGSLHRVVNVMSRVAQFETGHAQPLDDGLRPVRLRRGSLKGARPLEDLITSAAQQIFVTRTSAKGVATLEIETCSDQLAPGKAQFEDCASIRYYAIFTKSACAICANEALVRSYGSAWVVSHSGKTTPVEKRPKMREPIHAGERLVAYGHPIRAASASL